ncbi:MAG: thioredoxin domain-containing protein [Alphaproteobacteria bacterium]
MERARRTAQIAPATQNIGALPTVALILSGLGAALGAVILFIHHRMAASQGAYTSFCDVSAKVSCDVVLGSVYANVLGLPVALWGVLACLAAGALAWAVGRSTGTARLNAALGLAALAAVMLAISLWFLSVSAFVIRVACPLCLSLDAIVLLLFAAAVAILRQLRAGAPEGWPSWGYLGGVAAAAIASVLGLAGLQVGARGAGGPVTVAEVRERDPRFYAFYVSQQLVDSVPTDGGQVIGKADAPVTIVEFTDFECPYCGRAYQDLKTALADSPDVRVVVRNFPLNSKCNPQVQTDVHANACLAAIAGACAGAQGRFQEFQGLLFENQANLDRASLAGYAGRAGLDGAEFARCLDSPAASAAVAADVAAGAAAGVTSTPTFFINNRRIPGGFQGADQYRYALAIERELAGSAAKAAKP